MSRIHALVKHWHIAPPRRIANHHFDSARWSSVRHRPGDIVISSWAKSGTTWLQQIACQLVFDGRDDVDVSSLSPWVDMRITSLEETLATLESQKHRRVMKTHLPYDALPIRADVSYLYIAREPLDVVWSWYRHHNAFTDEAYEAFNSSPGRVGPPLPRPDPDFRRYRRRWLDEDGYPFHPYWDNILSWWNARNERNVTLMHFADLRIDLRGGIERVASALGIRPSKEALLRIQQHCGLEHMKRHAHLVAPLAGAIFQGGANVFIHSGASAQWRGVLNECDVSYCQQVMRRRLPHECAEWLTGSRCGEHPGRG